MGLKFLAGCDASPRTEKLTSAITQSSPAAPSPVAEEVFYLGQFGCWGPPEGFLEPPYEKTPTAASEKLRDFSLQAQALEAADPDRFYVMRIDTTTGDVSTVARSKAEARPNGHAPASQEQTDSFVTKALSDNIENRFNTSSSTYDTYQFIKMAGFFNPGGSCTATLFANYYVVTAAHCAVESNGPGNTTLAFSPRQRSYSSTPYGTGTTTYVEYETAFTARNCHVSYTYPDCIYYDFAIVGFGTTAFTNPGYLGFDWYGDTDFKNTNNRSIGYPACQGVNCDYGVPYCDFYCASRHPNLLGGSTSNSWPYNDGTNPMYESACDMTGGDSGSALISQADQNILGVQDFISCSDSSCTYSALGPRINGGIFDWKNSHR